MTINDVAKLAGVSKSTVSKVFNGAHSISNETKKKVLTTAKKLNYRPSRIAGVLKTKKTKTVAFFLPSMDSFFTAVIGGISDVAIRNGYMVFFCDTNEEMEREYLYLQMFEDCWVDGVIISGVIGKATEEKKNIMRLQKEGISIVLIDREIGDYRANVVMIDNEQAAYTATKYCVDLGHRRVGFVSAPLNTKIFISRFRGYRRALEENTIRFDQELLEEGDLSLASGVKIAEQFMKLHEPPTAIFAATDLMAIGVIKGIQNMGLRIPQDVSVVGFDNIPLAALIEPPLTTVAQPMYEMGKQAMSILIDAISGEISIKRKVILPTELIIRKSTAPKERNEKFHLHPSNMVSI